MSADNLEKAREGVISSALQWRASRRMTTLVQLSIEAALLSALEDLDHVKATGEFPPGKWEQTSL